MCQEFFWPVENSFLSVEIFFTGRESFWPVENFFHRSRISLPVENLLTGREFFGRSRMFFFFFGLSR